MNPSTLIGMLASLLLLTVLLMFSAQQPSLFIDLPALGIVAAVLGVVHALASADLPPSVMGELIAHAMVGTFLGVLLAYGFVSPLASLVEHRVTESLKVYQCVKVTLTASLNGYAPQLAVEFGRKILFSTERPSFTELDGHVRDAKAR